MAQAEWESNKMLDVYIYDYLKKRKCQSTAQTFLVEGNVANVPLVFDVPEGFLFEWWAVFWEFYYSRTNPKHSEAVTAYKETQRINAREHQQQLQMRLHYMKQQQAQLQRINPNHRSLNDSINAINPVGMPLTPQSRDSDVSQQLLNARMALMKSATDHTGQLVQGNPRGVSATLQKIQTMKSEGNLAVSQRSLPMDPSLIYGQGIMQAKPGLVGAGSNQGGGNLPVNGWPLSGIDQLHASLGAQIQKPFLSTHPQFHHLTTPQQQTIAHAQAQGSLCNSNYGDIDPRRFRTLPRSNLNVKSGLPTGADVSISSPIQSISPNIRPDQSEYPTKSQMQQPCAQPQDQLQLQQNNKRRKQATSAGPANSYGIGNTSGPSPKSPPSTPSTNTIGNGALTGNTSKSLMMYGADGMGRLASSSNQMDELDHLGDVASFDDNVESFLSNEDADGTDTFASSERIPVNYSTGSSKDYTFSETNCFSTRNCEVLCCDFSSDGKLLASAGHDTKAFLWHMDTQQTMSTPGEYTDIISDIRFRPNSTQLGTSSFDKTVRLWDAVDSSYCVRTYNGHSSKVTSLDFHPRKTDIFCSCDSNGEIRFWNVIQYSGSRLSKMQGGNTKVRFQPRSGQVLAAVGENDVSIFDVETDTKILSFQGHTKTVRSICWDVTGDFLASIDADSAKVWSLASGECINELLSTDGNKYHSCIFHPSYPNVLVIGGSQSLDLWNMVQNRIKLVQAHKGVITGLAHSPVTGAVATASYDKCVKVWK